MPLNDRQIKNAKPTDKPYKLSDGAGLHLVVTPAGGKLWRLKYRIDRKEKLLSIGKYPAVSLSEAREAANNARAMLAAGQDPSATKQQAKAERAAALANTFQAITHQWHAANLHRWKPIHAERVLHHFQKDVLPLIGNMPLDEINVAAIKNLLDRIVVRGSIPTAEKIRQWIGAVFEYAAMLELTDRNPARALKQYLPKPKTKHMPALPGEELTEFYRRLLVADVNQQNRIGVMLIMLVFLRNTELRGGMWAEIDFKAKLWRVPAERMKRPRPHEVPLSDWTIELLQELYDLTGETPYLFPSHKNTSGYISENTLGKIINNMGYKGIATPHGFRSLASSVLNEQGFNPDAIELQLAHVEENKIRAAYNRADYMEERWAMMQWYSDWYNKAVDSLKAVASGL
ncbi:integrase arm-type DNA-binding domain-containing protein [Neisseria arctica]|nr:integrase arm-type DNA-binding domain-containing protein [Neisseria arctica]UOO87346.1 integrase arm-type DNA-binding domain-containing protein [Neisseria arctica]